LFQAARGCLLNFSANSHGRNIAEARVVPLAAVKAFDVFLFCGFRIGPAGVPLMVHQFVFQAAPRRLSHALTVQLQRGRCFSPLL